MKQKCIEKNERLATSKASSRPKRQSVRTRKQRSKPDLKGNSDTLPITTLAAYDRVAALSYARGNWNKVATDLYIASGNHTPPYVSAPANTVFVHRPPDATFREHHDDAMSGSNLVLDWRGTDDCTHYLSCCIGRPPGGTAGGLSVPRDYPTGPYGVIACQKLFDWLRTQPNTSLVVEKGTDRALINRIAAGDLIFYWSARLGRYHHAGMYLGAPSGAIACHTYARSDAHQQWPMHWYDSAPDPVFSFFRMS